ncbi:PH domain-containing protein [Streptomyces sp. NPDC058773]|uniref:PH domain-containing protein n=1 Tax=Streptomyces sp. NPDC058773 TaxID=3346632 RepID=UPI003677FF8E
MTDTTGPAVTADDWQHLDRRSVAFTAALVAGIACGAAVPTTIGLAREHGLATALSWVLPVTALVLLLSPLAGLAFWRSMRYRITDELVETRFDLVVRSRRTLRRERLRTVDVTASPLHRLFGLAELTAGTGQGGKDGERVKLAPLHRHEADRIRRLLLNEPEPETETPERGPGVLAALDWSWLRYAPVSIAAPATAAAAFGLALKIADWFGAESSLFTYAVQVLGNGRVLPAVLALVAAGVLIGVLGSLLWFVEQWWDYRLERGPDGTVLHCRHGLFTTRSVSLEQQRLRGVDLVEPLGSRSFGAARVDAVGTGIRKADGDKKTAGYRTLLPTAPRATADRVAAAVLRTEAVPTSAALRTHPPAARRKRLVRAVCAVVAVCAVPAVLGVVVSGVLLHVAWISAVVLLPVAGWLGRDAYQSLGHGLSGAHLVTRSGTFSRHTVALERSGVVGWKIRQSVFQRRAGLLSVTAVTAAGSGGYTVYDAAEADGIALADAAVPGLLEQFLEPAGQPVPSGQATAGDGADR